MNKKTVVTKLQKIIEGKIPSAGTSEALLMKQSEFSRLCKEILEFKDEEKQQLREAFNRGVVHGMLRSSANRNEEVMYGFEQYYKENYEND